MTLLEQRSGNHLVHHPLAVRSCVSIEAWERFSFYGMQAILGFYLYYAAADGGLGLERTQATALVGAYGALVYLCTFAGGWIGDRIIGPEKTLLGGAILLVIGHISMSLQFAAISSLAIGLLFIALGSGMLKTAAITTLGIVYEGREQYRETGFQLFYFGIQLAAIGGPLLTGALAQRYDFHAGFLAAAILMVLGISIYLLLRPRMFAQLSPATVQALRTACNPASKPSQLGSIMALVALLSGVGYFSATGAVSPTTLAGVLLAAPLLAAGVMVIIMLRSPKVTDSERRRVMTYLPIFAASTAFWAILNQTYGVLAVYSDVRLDRSIGEFTIPAAWTQALNPFFIMVLSLPLAYLWAKLGDRGPSAAVKISIGVMIAGSGLWVLIPFAGGGEHSTPFIILALSVFVTSLGELFIGPIGMAATAAYAPRAFRTQFSALFFLTIAAGTALAGRISPWYNPDSTQAEITYFAACGAAAVLVGLITLVIHLRAAQA